MMCDVNCVAVFNDNYKYLLRVRGGGQVNQAIGGLAANAYPVLLPH